MNLKSKIKDVSIYFPDKFIDNDKLAEVFPDWPSEKIYQKTGIKKRYIVDETI